MDGEECEGTHGSSEGRTCYGNLPAGEIKERAVHKKRVQENEESIMEILNAIITIFSSITAVVCFILLRQTASKTDNTEMLQRMDEKIGGLSSQIMDQASKIMLHNTEKNAENMEKLMTETNKMAKDNAEAQQQLRDAMDKGLERIREKTEDKLTGIRNDINEKLDTSLNERLDKSFERVTAQLSELYKSLGELSEMSNGISSLNKTLTNVKTRGTWGELQLGAILEQVMRPEQYDRNVKLKSGSDDLVEFAIKIPSKEDSSDFLYLPIDSKFPSDLYLAVVDASSSGDPIAVQAAVKKLKARVETEARSIRDKYIVPPETTDFAIMFLPTEAMYAEVLKIDGLAEYCQTKYRVVISGPTTIMALLNSLQLGFANLALNKKTAEVRKILQAVKTQYAMLDEMIDTTQKKLDAAVTANGKLKERTAMIQRRMSKIDVLEDQVEAEKILLDEDEE